MCRQRNRIYWKAELCKAKRIEIYFTMSETKAAFAERTLRSLEKILYGHTEEKGYKLSQHVTTLSSRKNMLDRLDTKECQEIRLSVSSVQQATTRIQKTQV